MVTPLNKVKLFATLLAALATSCVSTDAGAETETPAADDTGYELEDSFLKLFSDGHDRKWYKADFAYLGPVQRAGWDADHIRFEGGELSLEITRDPKGGLPFTGAEYQRRGRYHYGRYEIVMKAASGSGLVSSYFTHTDGSQGGDPHDEIDIEFLGHRTRDLHLNYFTGGRAAGSVYVPLPYDAAETYQTYAFDWLPGEIHWYVGGQRVYSANDWMHPVPSTPSRLILNLWTGSANQYAWHGAPTFESGARVHYLCASYVAVGDTEAEHCSDHFEFDLPRVDLTQIVAKNG